TSFKGYRGYPATLCASINDEVVHGIPSASRALRDGDIISLDIGVKMDGYFGDCAPTVAVGPVPERTAALLQVTSEALDRAIAQVRIGGRLSDIGHAVQEWVEMHGFSVVREFVGHGIGERLHEEPQIPNYGLAGRGPKLAGGVGGFVGPGTGERLHEEPQIPNYGLPGRGPKLAEGMVLAIEPMVAMGRPE